MKKVLATLGAIVALTGCLLAASPAGKPDELAKGFRTPPNFAKPWAYWWWLNGYVTKEGITKDLEAMKRQGINGVLIFQAGGGDTPPGVRFLSPEWHELFRYTLREAARLGMDVSVNLCDGWDSGGPWIAPEQANKKLVYSEMQVDGGKRLSHDLPMPPVVDQYYRDVAVVGFREPAAHPVTPATVTASSTLEGYVGEWNFPPEDAVDSDPETFWSSANSAPSPQQPAWLALEYHEPVGATGFYVVPGPEGGPRECALETSTDGKTFREISRFSMEKGKAKRVEFAEAQAKVFRLSIASAYSAPVQVAEAVALRQGDEPQLRRGIKWWWFKSANRSFWDYPRQGPAALAEEYDDDGALDCRSGEVRDLTPHVNSQGHIDWDVPPGRWTILRFGYTLEGQRIRGESAGGRGGYEADMLSGAGIESQFRNAAEPLLADAAGTGTKALKYFHIDSYELGADVRGQQPTWSADFRDEFKKRRGYDLLPYLPAMARRIVDSRAMTDRFLWDFRQTVGDLMAERFWARFGELAHEHGAGVQGETGYGTYPYPHIDGLRCAGTMDIPMGEFWYGTDIMSQFNHFGNVIRTVATAAHVYGHPIVQAESFTAWTHWMEDPYVLKPVGDEAFVAGLNRMVFHQYTHQPEDIKPGREYFAGTHIDRHITWWEQARAFFQYLARCQYLLQQGSFVADALYYYGEGVTKFVPSKQYLHPALPPGYNFDAINSDILLHRLSVRDGRMVLPSGMSYRVLVLPEDGIASPEVLRKVKELVAEGATVVGPKPQRAPGLKDFLRVDEAVKRLADDIWAGYDNAEVKERSLGKGRIVWGKPLDEVLRAEGNPPDFSCGAGDAAAWDFIHRSTGAAEIYFVINRRERQIQADCTFRVSSQRPEFWDPVTGETRAAEAFRQVPGQITLPLELAPYGSLFVVFRETIRKDVRGLAGGNFPIYSNVRELEGPWRVRFDPQWGGPEEVEFAQLVSWTQRPEEGIKYYSGKATYRKIFDLSEELRRRDKRIALDLGELRNVAQVRLNGKDLGILWTKPFRVEITGSVKLSENILEIDIINLWPNRIIGDAASPPERRFTRTNISFKPDQPLLESGLLGPVRLQTITQPAQ